MFKRIFSDVLAIASLLVSSPVTSKANPEAHRPAAIAPRFDGFRYFGAGNGGARKRKSNRLQLSRNTKNRHRRNKRK